MQNFDSTINNIRREFLSYFAKNGHTIVPSSPLVPENDPTLLFANAGMNQFKDYFTGKKAPPFKAATTAQKCVRAGGKHNDLDNVGYTARHHTFFEMLGNFSFGDYFKEQAIYYAWTLVTKEFGLSPERLCVTIYTEDDDAYTIWKKLTGFPDAKIIRIATSDNFWSMGSTGPCGPCTEIFFDHGESVHGGPPGSADADADGDRFTEIWNIVFMQYNQQDDGIRSALPCPCIDTGMGLERIAAILQGKHSNFEIDMFAELIKEVRALTGQHSAHDSAQSSAQHSAHDHSCNVVADHIRAISFLIADGVLPLNEGRGYVLRRIIRRAFRHARILGATEPVLHKLVGKLVQLMGEHYGELQTAQNRIVSVIKEEETRFGHTLDRGLQMLDDALGDVRQGSVLSGDVAFKLYDTYGFPIDLTVDILRDKGISVDLDAFERAMDGQRKSSRSAGTLGIKTSDTSLALDGIPDTSTDWYDGNVTCEANVLAVVELEEHRWGVILDQTPFFPESCGQAGDKGVLKGVNADFAVHQVRKVKGWIVHEGSAVDGAPPKAGDCVTALIDDGHRARIRAHHSGTHMLQAALQRLFNSQNVHQHGSSVDATRLRFDFTFDRALTNDEIRELEHNVNARVMQALACKTNVCTKDDPLVKTALAYFNEKYTNTVRVVRLGELAAEEYFSTELCGGLHVANTGEIGMFKILSECGISAGVRRIEAVCGLALLDWYDTALGTAQNEIEQLTQENKRLNKQLRQAQSLQQKIEASEEQVGNVTLAIYRTNAGTPQQVRDSAEEIQRKMEHGVAVVIGNCDGQVVLIVGVASADQRNINAKELIRKICDNAGGRGGGNATIAQAGGIQNEERALEVVRSALQSA